MADNRYSARNPFNRRHKETRRGCSGIQTRQQEGANLPHKLELLELWSYRFLGFLGFCLCRHPQISKSLFPKLIFLTISDEALSVFLPERFEYLATSRLPGFAVAEETF